MSSGGHSPGGDDDDDEIVPHHDSHEGGEHGEPWLISYADMMTLLFGFFVIMYALAVAKTNDDDQYIKIKKSLAVYFGGAYVNHIAKVEGDIQKVLKENPKFAESTIITADADGMKIVIKSQVLFESGKAEILGEGLPILKTLVEQIGKDSKKFKIKIEGYTDSIPIHNERFASNWDLSAGRAIAVLNVFQQEGFDPEYLQAIGMGSTHPLMPNVDKDGNSLPDHQAQNRRVVIRVLEEDEAKPSKPILVPAGVAAPGAAAAPAASGAPASHETHH